MDAAKLAELARSFLQGANNAAASTVSAPVDGVAWLMRHAGVPVSDSPLGGSNWMAQYGLTRAPQNELAGLVGEAAGGAAPLLAGAYAPQVANALLAIGRNAAGAPVAGSRAAQYGRVPVAAEGATPAELATAQANAARPTAQGGLGLPEGNTASDRMAAMNMAPGWFRGGEVPRAGRPTGPWYTQVRDEAADYAARTPAASRDVREYAPANANRLRFDGGYPSRMADDLAGLLERDGHQKAAAELRRYYADGSPISGMEAYKFLQRFVGEGAPEQYLRRLGFRSVEGVNSPNYRQVLDDTIVRDATRAAFDPMRRAERNIFAGGAAAVPLASWLLDRREAPQ